MSYISDNVQCPTKVTFRTKVRQTEFLQGSMRVSGVNLRKSRLHFTQHHITQIPADFKIQQLTVN